MTGFESITSLNSYVRSNEMTRKWTIKKNTGDMTADGTMSVSDAWRQKKNAQDKLMMQGLVADQDESKENDKMTAIRTKMYNGETLTPDELKLLRQKDPQAYQEELNRRQSAESYKRDLSNARTKEEFQRIRMSRAAVNLTRLSAVKNDSAIPESAKLAVYADINARVKSEREIERKFVESGEYDRLPTEMEKAEAEQAAREEISGENKIHRDNAETDGQTEQTDQTDTAGEKDQTVQNDGDNRNGQPAAVSGGKDQTIQNNDDNRNVQPAAVSGGKNQTVQNSRLQKPADSSRRLKEDADRIVSEVDQKSEAELDEIRRKVNRANQRRNKFIRTDTDDTSASQVSFQV